MRRLYSYGREWSVDCCCVCAWTEISHACIRVRTSWQICARYRYIFYWSWSNAIWFDACDCLLCNPPTQTASTCQIDFVKTILGFILILLMSFIGRHCRSRRRRYRRHRRGCHRLYICLSFVCFQLKSSNTHAPYSVTSHSVSVILYMRSSYNYVCTTNEMRAEMFLAIFNKTSTIHNRVHFHIPNTFIFFPLFFQSLFHFSVVRK